MRPLLQSRPLPQLRPIAEIENDPAITLHPITLGSRTYLVMFGPTACDTIEKALMCTDPDQMTEIQAQVSTMREQLRRNGEILPF